MDGDPTKNLPAFEKVVRAMHDAHIGYGAINHPVVAIQSVDIRVLMCLSKV